MCVRKMHQCGLQFSVLREELAEEVNNFCYFAEMNIGILTRDAAQIYRLVSAEQNFLEDLAFFCAY